MSARSIWTCAKCASSCGFSLLASSCSPLFASRSIPLASALPFWHNPRGFGPFPNRNQTANLFGLTAVVILACGQDDIRHGRKRWIVWLLGLAIIVAAIVLNFSRAGILILVAGIALWLGAICPAQQARLARIALGLSALLILLTVMLVFGGQTLRTLSSSGRRCGRHQLRIFAGRFSRTLFNSFVLRPGAALVWEISTEFSRSFGTHL